MNTETLPTITSPSSSLTDHLTLSCLTELAQPQVSSKIDPPSLRQDTCVRQVRIAAKLSWGADCHEVVGPAT